MVKMLKIRLSFSKLNSVKVKCLMTGFLILFLLYISTVLMFRKHHNNVSSVKLENVVVHFDFKGSPPKLTYLRTLLPMLKSLGATGFLMEYEDMFPYEGRLENISASNHYGKSELKDFLHAAVSLGFEIIPLVQTFGHLEHVLKLAQFQYLREVSSYPDSICPSQRESQELIRDMLEQVIHFHNDVTTLRHFHIGCDEVYHINKCIKCREQHLQDMDIFVSHIETVRGMLKEFSPGTTVLIWDDMLRNQNTMSWIKIKELSDVEPVYWDYRPIIDISHMSLLKYHHSFKEVWIASAFKGADGRIATLPNLKHRFLNHLRWMNLIRGYKISGDSEIFNFKGIILTGWSRYSHMDPPCELLPSSLPSLVLNLLIIQQFREGVSKDLNYFYIDDIFSQLREKFNNHLHCGSSISVEYFDNYQCSFEGNELYKIQRLNSLLQRNITIGFNDINHGLSAVEYYANTNNINRALAGTNLVWCNETLIDLLKIERQMAHELAKYFDSHFINEYINFKTNNGKRILYKLSKGLLKAVNVRTWLRRPYT